MQKFNGLWKTYIFIVTTSVIFAGVTAYFIWLNTHTQARTELIYSHRVISNSTQSVLSKNEGLLKTLGELLIALRKQQDPAIEPQQLFDSLLKTNPEIAGFGLAAPSGRFILASFDINNPAAISLQKNPASAVSFKKTLNSSQMVVGRTYYMKSLQQWVIPLRQRITDKNGLVTGVMTSGLKLESNFNTWSGSFLPSYMNTFLVREDFYRQYAPKAAFSSAESAYSQPIPYAWVRKFEDRFGNEGATLATIRNSSPEIFTSVALQTERRAKSLVSISYNPRFAHYTIIATPYELISQRLLIPLSVLALASIIFNLVLFWTFRSNIRLQNTAKNTLEQQATHDPLTGLPNRRHLLKAYPSWQAHCHGDFYIIFMDINNFKSCNDLHGHSVGDQILQEVASRINNCFPECLKIRPGGDEFIILTPSIDAKHVIQLCDNFFQQLKQPILVSQLDFSITVSMGIAHTPSNGRSLDDLLRKADMAMYQAKATGARHFIYSDHLEEKQRNAFFIEQELRLALERDELFLVYQAQVEAQTKNIVGIETLIRWKNEKLGMVPPDVFIPIAESTGLIIDIGRFVLQTSMRELAEITKKQPKYKNLQLSVNISVQQLFHSTIINDIQQLTDLYPSIPLCIEVTESLFIEDLKAAKRVLDEIQAIGVKISLDDFGTGYSSLSVLTKLPINELKIDKSFIQHVLSSKSDKNLIQSIINIGKSLQIPVLSEGVEEKEQADLLLEFGCDLFQGYYFAKPMESTQLVKHLKAHTPNNEHPEAALHVVQLP
ncbi:MAG: EAL domain-containing protein [Cycloclasticus sp.]